MSPIYQVVIPGRIVAKKNAKKPGRRGNRLTIISKPEWIQYKERAVWVMKAARGRHGLDPTRPYLEAVSIQWAYYPDDRKRPDTTAISETVADLLEDAKVIQDDRQVAHCDGSRLMGIDKKNPRLVIMVSPYKPGPSEYDFKVPAAVRKRYER